MKRESILKNNIKMKFIGRKDRLKDDVVRIMEETESITKNNSKITLTIAIDYGAKDEIIRSIKKLSPEEIKNLTEDSFKKYLDTSFLPPVDLLIRTAGEKRISNFLLWDIAYAELYFTDTLWPDFTEEELEKAVHEFSMRERRFGAIKNA